MNIRILESVRRATVLVAAVLGLVTACGDDNPVAPDKSVENNLVFTREDGSRIEFLSGATLFVWCGPWDGDLVPAPSLHIIFGGPSVGDPYWSLGAVVDDVIIGEQMSFPNSFVWDQPKGVAVFVSDRPNECSTAELDAGGYVVFQRFGCGDDGQVQLSIDAVLGSEYGDGPPITVRGTFKAPIGQPPE